MSRIDDIIQIQIGRIRLSNGRIPFDDWLESLDFSMQARVMARLRRLKSANFGDFKELGDGVSELRLNFGAGYRVYFGRKDAGIVLLICGGDKHSQKADIRRAKFLWAEYLRNELDALLE